jgi:hypothetical protein
MGGKLTPEPAHVRVSRDGLRSGGSYQEDRAGLVLAWIPSGPTIEKLYESTRERGTGGNPGAPGVTP